jgi:hypothetical protein
VAEIVANSLLEPLFSEAEAERLEPFAERAAQEPGEAALISAARRALAERTQRESLSRLAATGLPIRKLPRLESGAGSHAAVLELAAHLP